MKKKQINKLQALANDKLNTLQPSNLRKGKYKPTFLEFEGYTDLFITIEALINVSILAAQGDTFSPPRIKDHGMDIRRTLELANSLLPFEEGEFLDESYRLFKEDPKSSF
ncbi:hypothetical protein HX109_04870 [Galbibacter sp. BG1]|uniref:hypothetical protein n=1 Tax=Galbibacter sp. BG1 TaxID=1170699 RepID=UPI0015C14030|nr:hypothetical protein [Galbibacter sp. BG1]QLE00928.1 hypothetical protein HX109_04870 [Galbibacter sp. BG1]